LVLPLILLAMRKPKTVIVVGDKSAVCDVLTR
jgi:hypothetical protein